jgi:hypothetical protein
MLVAEFAPEPKQSALDEVSNILKLSTRRRRVASFTLHRFYSKRKSSYYPFGKEVEWTSELVRRKNVNCKLNKLQLFPASISKNLT